MRVLHCLNNVSASGVYFGTSLQVYRALVPIGWRIVQILLQRQRKAINSAPSTLSAMQAAIQFSFIHAQLYSTSD